MPLATAENKKALLCPSVRAVPMFVRPSVRPSLVNSLRRLLFQWFWLHYERMLLGFFARIRNEKLEFLSHRKSLCVLKLTKTVIESEISCENEKSSAHDVGLCPVRQWHPYGAAKQRWGLKMSQFSTNNSIYLRNDWR